MDITIKLIFVSDKKKSCLNIAPAIRSLICWLFILIYLSTLDTSAVDNANSEILAALGEWRIRGVTDKKCVNTQKLYLTKIIITTDDIPTHTMPNGIIMMNVFDYLLS